MPVFFKPTPYNGETKCQMWMSIIQDTHDIHCGCPTPYAHLLSSIFPEGHHDRNLTIQQIINRDYQLCRSGGEEETNHGLALGASAANLGLKEEKEENHTGEKGDIEELLAAAADAEAR